MEAAVEIIKESSDSILRANFTRLIHLLSMEVPSEKEQSQIHGKR